MLGVTASSPDQARRDAQSILEGDAFKAKAGPRPLRGVLEWIGHAFEPVGRGLARFWNTTFGKLPPGVMWLAIIAMLGAVVYAIARYAQSRSASRDNTALGEPRPRSTDDSPEALEAEALLAEQDGDHSRAIRLRFRAGLLRLDRDASAIAVRPGLTTREVRDSLRQPTFDSLADRFEDIAYGGDVADPNDTVAARTQWPTVVKASRRG